MFNINKKNFKQLDFSLLLTVLIVCILGLFILQSAVVNLKSANRILISQVISTIIGFCFIALIVFIDSDFIKKLAMPIYIISILLLVLTLILGKGEEVWGARSWLKFGPIQFQPAELTKIGILISVASILEKNKESINKPLTLFKLIIIVAIPLFLILKQPDFGTCMVYIFFIAIMFFTARISWKWIILAIIIVSIAIPLVFINLKGFQLDRILNFVDSSRDVQNTGYQTHQATIAIGSGQLFGRGYMKGTQTMYGFVPEQHTDFIFVPLVEQFGFIGGIFLIALYGFMLFRILMITKYAKDMFSKTLTMGVAAMLFVHIFENIGMNIGLMPVTGIPLPFMSNGGTFQMLNLIAIGLVLSISVQKRPLDFK